MSDLSKVKEVNIVTDLAHANKHLTNGWVLIAVNSVSVSGNAKVSTEYVLGWENALPSKYVPRDEDDTVSSKYAPKYEDHNAVERKVAKPKHKTISIID